jgi:hypothetical protein
MHGPTRPSDEALEQSMNDRSLIDHLFQTFHTGGSDGIGPEEGKAMKPPPECHGWKRIDTGVDRCSGWDHGSARFHSRPAVATTGSPEHGAPFADAAVAGDHKTAALVTLRDELEEEVRGIRLERQIAELIVSAHNKLLPRTAKR